MAGGVAGSNPDAPEDLHVERLMYDKSIVAPIPHDAVGWQLRNHPHHLLTWLENEERTPLPIVLTTTPMGGRLSSRQIKRASRSYTLQRHLHRIGVKDSACCPLCHQGEMDDDHLRHCSIVVKFFVDNPMEVNFDSFFASSSFYSDALRLMAQMPKMGAG
ncbi:hypothetical protein TNCV_357191 [Trichonephila clavipes]|nr:hypothetical protein TNCV_357191 [Trichonephila clavipes]